MTERKTTPASGRAKKDKAVPKIRANAPAQGSVPNPDQDDRDSRGAASHADASQHKGGARDATSTGGQQQGGPGSPPFPRFDRANDGGSAKNR
jgi:hypothetical protein